eukprot:2650007-Rhodomonas_salina.1
MDAGGHTRSPFAAGSSRSAGDEARGRESEAAPDLVCSVAASPRVGSQTATAIARSELGLPRDAKPNRQCRQTAGDGATTTVEPGQEPDPGLVNLTP